MTTPKPNTKPRAVEGLAVQHRDAGVGAPRPNVPPTRIRSVVIVVAGVKFANWLKIKDWRGSSRFRRCKLMLPGALSQNEIALAPVRQPAVGR